MVYICVGNSRALIFTTIKSEYSLPRFIFEFFYACKFLINLLSIYAEIYGFLNSSVAARIRVLF